MQWSGIRFLTCWTHSSQQWMKLIKWHSSQSSKTGPSLMSINASRIFEQMWIHLQMNIATWRKNRRRLHSSLLPGTAKDDLHYHKHLWWISHIFNSQIATVLYSKSVALFVSCSENLNQSMLEKFNLCYILPSFLSSSSNLLVTPGFVPWHWAHLENKMWMELTITHVLDEVYARLNIVVRIAFLKIGWNADSKVW